MDRAAWLVVAGAAGYGIYLLVDAVDSAVKESIGRPRYWPLVDAAATSAGIPPEILAGVVKAESSWSNAANRKSDVCGVTCIASSACAVGLAQVLSSTAGMTAQELCDPETNLRASAKYLRTLYDKYGNWRVALVAYNWGPGHVDEWVRGNRDIYSGSLKYADKVLAAVETYGGVLAGLDVARPTSMFRVAV